MLERLKKFLHTLLLFIRAFEIACLVVRGTNKKSLHQEKKKKVSLMGASKTVIGSVAPPPEQIPKKEEKNEDKDEIDYEAESIPLETVGVSFDALEKLSDVLGGKAKATEEDRQTLKSMEGTDLGVQVKNRIAALLDEAEQLTGKRESTKPLADLSALFD